MLHVNENYSKIKPTYLFAEIAHRVAAHQAEHPEAKIIRLGIGDVTEPLCPAVVEAMHKAVDDEAGKGEKFYGYGPEQGYAFLRDKIAAFDYQARGIDIRADEILVSDGAKCDCGNIQELFAADVKVAVGDPVYPVYVDTNVMAGRHDITLMPCNAANGFVPEPWAAKAARSDERTESVAKTKSNSQANVENGQATGQTGESTNQAINESKNLPDIVYLCYPNNPTGAVATKAQLQAWVDWANANKKLILFDAAYEAFIRTPGIPHSIYECEGARKCAIEFRSYSKTAGFTGVRCGYTVVPSEVVAYDSAGNAVPLKPMWTRRQTTKFNGASYLTQRGAEAIYTPEGQRQVKATIDFYLENARLVREALAASGFTCYGGVDSPYVWVDVKGDSWTFFDKLLKEANVVTTPGAGFGKAGEGYIRISAFNSRANVLEAIERIKKCLG